MKISVDLKLEKELILQIEGEYTKAENNVRLSSQLEIEEISFLKGGLMEYTNWCNNYVNSISSEYDDLWQHLTELALEQYEKTI